MPTKGLSHASALNIHYVSEYFTKPHVADMRAKAQQKLLPHHVALFHFCVLPACQMSVIISTSNDVRTVLELNKYIYRGK